jgi:hypothetical protein
MAENPLGHEINVATDEEILSFLAGSYPATNTDKLSDPGSRGSSRVRGFFTQTGFKPL